jgi:hypothetical protein
MIKTRAVRWWPLVLCGAALIPLVYACEQDQRIAAPTTPPISRPLADTYTGPLGSSYQIGAPNTNLDAVGPSMTQIVIPAGRLVTVTVSGTITYTANSAVLLPIPDGCGPLGLSPSPGNLTTVGPAGFPPTKDPRFNGVAVGGQVEVYESDAFHPPPYGIRLQFQPQDAQASVVTATVQGFPNLGRLWVYRPPSFPGGCATHSGTPQAGFLPSHFASGSQLLDTDVPTCHLPVPPQYQADAAWQSQPYDNLFEKGVPVTIGAKGCALTSLSMALTDVGYVTNPGDLNAFMKQSTLPDFSGGDVAFPTTVEDVTARQFKFKWTRDSTAQDLGALACRVGRPVLVGVGPFKEPTANDIGAPSHYVLVTGQDASGTVFINDAGHTEKTTLDAYGTRFKGRGYVAPVADPPGDQLGGLTIAVNNQRLLLTDASGRRTGWDAVNGREVFEIPQSGYVADALEHDLTTVDPTTYSAYVNVFQPAVGTYRIDVLARVPGAYTVSVAALAQDRSVQPTILVRGVTDGTTTTSFNVVYSASPGVAPALTRLVTFASVIQDIATSRTLGLIDNQHLADGLRLLIQAAQYEVAQGRVRLAKDILVAFTYLVQAARPTHIKDAAATVLLDDAAGLSASL